MSNESWIAITIAFVLGAMSPGPSLSIVLRNTLVKGKTNGVLTGLGHGFGFSLFSLTVLISFSNLLNYFPKTGSIFAAALHNSFTAFIETSKFDFSLFSSSISKIFSTPFFPIITGTPAYISL